MLRRVAIALLCLPLLGLGIIPISGRRDAAPPAGGIEDDFSGDLSKWTVLDDDTPTIVSGYWKVDGYTAHIYTDEQTSTVSQWGLVEYADAEYTQFGPVYAGIYFRSTNLVSEWAYCLRGQWNPAELLWRYCKGTNCTNIETCGAADIEIGDWIGFEVTGTGNDTVVKAWDFDDAAPADRGSWGSPTCTLTNDPANAADTGKYVGLYQGSNSAWTGFDNFSAGDI